MEIIKAQKGCYIAYLCLLAFIVLLIYGVNAQAGKAIAPPIFDAFTFYQKAFNVWRGITSEGNFHIFKAEPTTRPPGCVLVVAPFGISKDVFHFQGSLARSIYIPILIWMMACWLAFPLEKKAGIDIYLKVALVSGIGLLPMFLVMEINPNIPSAGFWGLQDTLVASLSALSLACIFQGLERRSVIYSLIAAGLAAYTFWVKPVGILIVLVIYGYWFVEGLCRYIFSRPQEKRQVVRYAVISLPLMGAITFAMIYVALQSEYLSRTNLEYALVGQALLIQIYKESHAAIFVPLIQRSVGFLWGSLFAIGILIFSFWKLFFSNRARVLSALHVRLVCGVIVFGASVYWWLFLAGPQERYIYPFILILLLSCLPEVWTCVVRDCNPRHKALMLVFLSGLSLAQLLMVLFPNSLSEKTQELLGVNFSSGGYRDSVEAAKCIVDKSKNHGCVAQVYRPDANDSLGFVEGYLCLSNLQNSGSYSFVSPWQWRPDNVVGKEDLISSDFIIFDNSYLPQSVPDGSYIADFPQELNIFKTWFSQLDAKSGVDRCTFGKIGVLEVNDWALLSSAFDALVKRFQWRPEFRDKLLFLSKSQSLFESSSLTAMEIAGADLARNAVGLHEIEMSEGNRNGSFKSTGSDPYILLEPFDNQQATRAVAHLTMSSSQASTLQLFYRAEGEGFSESKSIRVPAPRHEKEFWFEFPLCGERTYLRIDPGTVAGEYSLSNITVRLLSK